MKILKFGVLAILCVIGLNSAAEARNYHNNNRNYHRHYNRHHHHHH